MANIDAKYEGIAYDLVIDGKVMKDKRVRTSVLMILTMTFILMLFFIVVIIILFQRLFEITIFQLICMF